MAKINIRFIADHATLMRDENNNLIVEAQGIDEEFWKNAPENFTKAVAAAEEAEKHEAEIEAEIRRKAEESLKEK